MGVAERRLREKEQRRMTILDAAEKVFFEKGVDRATMDAVAETAELSKGLLYFYFRNKEDLAHAIAHRGLRVLGQFFEKALRDHEKGIDQVTAIGRAYMRFAREYPDYFNIMSWFEAQPGDGDCPGTYAEACNAEGSQCIGLVAQAVRNGIEDGTIRPELDPLETAITLWAQTHGLIHIISYKEVQVRHQVDAAHLVETAFDLMKAGLEPH
ncbi:TetR/AcrR family transcriptional regulator [Rhodocaloribacter sp.]|jgi:AcrR family transcriptional regulator